jgi:hypothetical protein
MTGTRTQTSDLVIRGIPTDLHRQLKVSAAASGISVKELVISLLQKHVGPGGTLYVPFSGEDTPATEPADPRTRIATPTEHRPHAPTPS